MRAILCALAVLLCGAPRWAAADPCLGEDARGFFAVCFDLGNRLALGAGTNGFGGEIDVRHRVRAGATAAWHLEHRGFATAVGYPGIDPRYAATLYEGRFTYHTRDGHLTIPTSHPRIIHLPFDIGAEAQVARVTGRSDSSRAEVRVIGAGAFVDLARASDFRSRLAIGTAVAWDMEVDGGNVDVLENRVTPFSTAVLDAYLESWNGLTHAGVRVEGGALWSDVTGWHRAASARASIERVLLSVQDRPLTVYLEAGWTLDGRTTAAAGLRFAVLGARPWSTTFKQSE